MAMVSTAGTVVSSKTELRFPIAGQQGHRSRNIHYSKEELVAEIGSANILNMLGIETDHSFRNTAAYIQSWLKVLKNDIKFIVSASSKAEKATKYIMNIK